MRHDPAPKDEEQPDLFALARNTDPDTSHAAAASVDVAQREALVVAALKLRGALGATTHEIADAVGLERDSISPRMKPLVEKGFIFDSGERRTWHGSNRACIVWKDIAFRNTGGTCPHCNGGGCRLCDFFGRAP